MTGKRRGHNEGSIYQRADGRFVGAVSLGMVNGKRKRRVVYGRTHDEVRRAIRRLQADLDRGIPVQTASATVAAFLDRWLAWVKPNVRPKTYASYVCQTQTHLKPALGSYRLEKLSQHHVNQMMTAMQTQGLSVTSVTYARNVLRAALNQAMKWDMVGRNVAALADPPAAVAYEPYAFSASEAARLLTALRGDRLEALYAIALAVGLRQGELLGLRWRDVDIDAGTVTVRYQLQKVDGHPTFTEPKSKSGRRTIALPASVTATVRQHRTRQLEERMRAGGAWQAQWDLVFATPTGSPMNDVTLRKHFRQVLERTGLWQEAVDAGRRPPRFHDLRHSAASFLAARGVHPSVAKAILGHANISTTLQVYTSVGADTIRGATALVDDLFVPAKEAK